MIPNTGNRSPKKRTTSPVALNYKVVPPENHVTSPPISNRALCALLFKMHCGKQLEGSFQNAVSPLKFSERSRCPLCTLSTTSSVCRKWRAAMRADDRSHSRHVRTALLHRLHPSTAGCKQASVGGVSMETALSGHPKKSRPENQ